MDNRKIIIIVVSVVVLCLVGVGCAICAATGLLSDWWDGGLLGQAAPKTGQPAPDFQLETIAGEPISLHQFRGRPVLVNFWATWCYPCVEEMPLLEDRFEAYTPDLVIIAIEDGSDLAEVRDFVEDTGLTFIVGRDSTGIQQQYGITAFPTSFFIDADGVVQAQVIGSMVGSQLDRELSKIGLEP